MFPRPGLVVTVGGVEVRGGGGAAVLDSESGWRVLVWAVLPARLLPRLGCRLSLPGTRYSVHLR